MYLFKKLISNISFMGSFTESKKDIVFIAVASLITIIVIFMPTGFEESAAHTNAVRCRASIIKVNNEFVRTIGPVRHGFQNLEIKILSGKFKGITYTTTNNLTGKMEMDKIFSEGDNALVVLTLTNDGEVSLVTVNGSLSYG